MLPRILKWWVVVGPYEGSVAPLVLTREDSLAATYKLEGLTYLNCSSRKSAAIKTILDS